MDNTSVILEKIDNVFNLMDNDQEVSTDDILEISGILLSFTESTLPQIPDQSKHKLLSIIKKNLQTTNTELQKNTLTLLCYSFDLNLFSKDQIVSEILMIIIDGAFKKKVENLEDQELWLKALDTLLKFTESELTPIIIKHSIEILEAIKLALTSKVINSPKKLKALKLLNEIISKITLDKTSTNLLLSILFTILIPTLFSDDCRHFKHTIDVANNIINKIPHRDRVTYPTWTKFKETFISTYGPFMSKMIIDEKLTYSQLVIFSLKILHTEIHGPSSNLVNSILGTLEKAFKGRNMSLRKEAFLCWQEFIKSFLLTENERIPTQRINLLTVPLKTNNCKTNELILCKYQTWCILLNTIHKLNIFPKEFAMMLQNFLHFSFGLMGETPLLSYTLNTVSPGKTIPKLHMEMCQNFFKIIAGNNLLEKYTPVTNMKIVSDSPMLTVQLFIKMSRTIIYSVGEASILLSNCTENEEHAKKLNNLLWQALFELCQNTIVDENVTILWELNALIMNIIEVSKTRPKLSIFCTEVILSLIMLDKYSFCKIKFEEKTLFEHLFTMLFKDIKYFYSQSNAAIIFELILKNKKSTTDFTTFISKSIDQLFNLNLAIPEDRVIINNFFEMWILLEKEIIEEIFRNEDDTPISLISNYKSLMIWCITNINLCNEKDKIINIWKNSLKSYSLKLGERYYTINSLCNIFATKILSLPIKESSAEFFIGIISCMCFKRGREVDYKKELINVLNLLNEFILKKNLSTSVVSTLKNCVEIVFKNIIVMGAIARILPVLLELVISFNSNYPEVCLADTVIPYLKDYKPTDRTKVIIDGMLNTLQNAKNEKYAQYYEEFKKKISEQPTEINENVEPDSSKKKTDKTIIDGIDINTMTPVKLKGSLLSTVDSKKNEPELKPPENVQHRIKKPPNLPMNDDFIFVNSPYSFNPKKLTKSQKEKFRQKRDDIPAMYNDLSQSQTMELSNSCSNFENVISNSQKSENNSVANVVQIENQEKGAFSQINENKIETEEKNKEIESPKPNSTKKPGYTRELHKIKMDNIMGFEDYLQQNATSSRPYTRKRQVKTDTNEGSTKKDEPSSQKKRGRKRKELKDEEEGVEKHSKKEENTTDIIESSQILSQDTNTNKDNQTPEKEKSKKQVSLEDLGIKKLDDATVKPSTNHEQYKSVINNLKDCRVHIEAPKIVRRNSLESSDLSTPSEDNSKKSNRGRKRVRRNSLKEEILTAEANKVVPKIKLLRSPVERKQFLIEKQPENAETSENDTESVPSDIFSEEIVTDYPNANQSICRKVLFDKNDDSDCTDLDTSKEKCNEPIIEIISSPVRHDTPTRNKELLESTSEISPIKSPVQRNLENIPSNEKSPELFSENSSKEGTSECLTPVIPKKNSRKGKFVLQGRGAQMMNLIVPKGNQSDEAMSENTSSNKNEQKNPGPSVPLSSSSRIGKMMVQFDVKSSEKVDEKMETPSKSTSGEEDFLHFTKNLPLPTASPRYGILRKRKRADDLEEGLSPCAKKKRVNFNDPPLSSIKFIEKYQYIRNRSSSILFGQSSDNNSENSETPRTSDEEHNFNKQKVTQIDSINTHTLNVLEIAYPVNENIIKINGVAEETDYVDMQKMGKVKKVALVGKEITFVVGSKENDTENTEFIIGSKENDTDSNEVYVIDSDSPTSPEENVEIIEISSPQNDRTSSRSENKSETTSIDLEPYNGLKTCTELLTDCLKDSNIKNKLVSALTEANVKTMGELASYVIENPRVLVEFKQMKDILDEHNCNDHQPKKRKIIPITLSSPLNKKSNKVSVISSPQEKHSEDIFGGSSQSEPTAHNRNITESQLSCNWISPISHKEQSFNIPLSGGPKENLVTQINNISSESPSSSTNSLNWNQLFCNDIGVDKVTKLLLLEEKTRENNIVSMVTVIASYNAPKLFETILGLVTSSEKISRVFKSSFIPNILKNPETTCCIANNLSLLELQEHLVERLTKDHENKETFLKRLNRQLGNKTIVNISNESSVSDSQVNTISVDSIFEQIKTLNVTDNDWDTLCEMTTFLQNMIHKKFKNLVKKNSS